jgi:hypothetical protein
MVFDLTNQVRPRAALRAAARVVVCDIRRTTHQFSLMPLVE